MTETPKLIITCAVTGSDTFPSQTPYIPCTPDEIAEEAYNAYKTGAAIIHAHARDESGKPTSDLKIWREILTKIKDKCDVVICVTTGGALGMTAQERISVVPEFEPELCSFNTESMNFGLFSAMAAQGMAISTQYMPSPMALALRHCGLHDVSCLTDS